MSVGLFYARNGINSRTYDTINLSYSSYSLERMVRMIFNIPSEKYSEANRYDRRDCYEQLKEYIDGESTKVFIIYGLLRTGKSTLMFQAIKDTGIENTGYILCEDGDDNAKT